MHPLDVSTTALAEICRRYGVRRLALFGSAARGDPEPGDIDLIAAIEAPTASAYAERYLALREDLESLFDKPVDLLTDAALANPFLRTRVEAEAAVLFES